MRQLIVSKVKVGLIAKKLKRSPGAIYARMNSIKKKPLDLEFSEQRRSLPSAAHELSQLADLQLTKTADGMPARRATAALNSRTETQRRRLSL